MTEFNIDGLFVDMLDVAAEFFAAFKPDGPEQAMNYAMLLGLLLLASLTTVLASKLQKR